MSIQTRSEINGLEFYSSLKDAFQAAKEDPTVWKISFDHEGNPARFVRNSSGCWVYSDLMEEIKEDCKC